MSLNLYLLRRDDTRYYADETVSAVVAASDPELARYFAQSELGAERADTFDAWVKASTSVTLVGTAAEFVDEGVIHTDYRGHRP